jgi:hypothetical protein
MSIFMGVPQSKIAGTAILVAVVVVALSILFGKEPIPLTQKFVIILVMFLLALPAILLSLFQINCLVTGAGLKNQRWWCGLYAWVISVMVVFYCVMLVIVGLLSYSDDKKVVAQEKFRNMQKFANINAEGFFAEEAKKEEEKGKALATATLPEPPKMPEPPKLPEIPSVTMDAPSMSMGGAPAPEGFEDMSAHKKEAFTCGAPLYQ